LENFDINEIMQTLVTYVTTYGLRILAAIVIFVVGRIVANVVSSGARKAMRRGEVDENLVGFVASLVRFGIMAFTIIAVISQLGVQTTSFVAVLGAAGLAVGLALQGSLGNFAAGVMLLIFRPFKKGDFVEVAGTAGSVNEISVFTTILTTPDNKKIIVPNSQVTGGVIVNYSATGTRRVDLVAGIGYSDDIGKAKGVLERIVSSHSAILAEPAPVIEVSELADSSVNFVVRPWVNSADYWRVYWDLTEAIKIEFDKEGISIPFPQRDVHLFQESAQG
jgi:small conductance mechanosensitive channel